MKVKTPKVVIVWVNNKEDLEEGCIHYLNSYMGIRVYEKDKLDPRITMGSNEPLPFADEWDDAYQFLTNNPKKQIQITTGLAKRLGLFQD
jgi:hypothetical protein